MARSSAPVEPTESAARQLASEVFVLGFPLLLMDVIRRAHPFASTGFHRFAPGSEPLIPGLFVDDPDCLHTTAVLDLASTACVLHLPNTHGRYLSVTLFDAAGEPFATLGTHSGEASGGDVVVASPRWRGEVETGVRALRAPCDFVWILSRIVGRSPLDRPMVEAFAARQHFSRAVVEPAVPGPEPRAAQLPWLEPILVREVLEIEPLDLFHRFTQLVERAPATTQRQIGAAISARLALLGCQGPGQPDAVRREVMRRGFVDGWKAVQLARAEAASSAVAGEWKTLAQGAEAQPPGSARSAAAFDRLGAPLPQDILGLRCAADATGRTLTGAEQYRILLPAAELPPALSAWRLSANEGRLPGTGAVIGDHSPLVLTQDGSLEILIRKDPPRRRLAANWLPAPAGPFELTLRLFEPTADALAGRWRMRTVERLGAGAETGPAWPNVDRRARRRVPRSAPSAARPRPST